MATAEVRQSLERDASVSKPMTSAEFTAFVAGELKKWTPVVRTFAKPN